MQPPPTSTTSRNAAQEAESALARQGRNTEVDFHGQKRGNDTHLSTTNPDARLFRKGKGKEARLAYMGHALSENRHGLIVEADLTPAAVTAVRETPKDLVDAHVPGSTRRLTLGATRPTTRPASSSTAAPCA